MSSVKGKTKMCHCPICGKDYEGSLYKKTESPCDDCKNSKKSTRKPKEAIERSNTNEYEIEFIEDEGSEENVISDVCRTLNSEYDWKSEFIAEYNRLPLVIKQFICPICGADTHPIRVHNTFYCNVYECQCDNNDCGATISFTLPNRSIPIRQIKGSPIHKTYDWSGHIKDWNKKCSDSAFEHFIEEEYRIWEEGR